MNWYHISFSERDLFEKYDQNFIKEFINFIHLNNNPEKLGLYKLKFEPDDLMVYYLSTPKELDYEIKKTLSFYKVQIVASPNTKVLELVLGK